LNLSIAHLNNLIYNRFVISTLRELEAQTRRYNSLTTYSILIPKDLDLPILKSIIRKNIKAGSSRGFDISLPEPEAEIVIFPNELESLEQTPDRKIKAKRIHDLAVTMQAAEEVIIFSHLGVSRNTRLSPSVDFTSMPKLEAVKPANFSKS